MINNINKILENAQKEGKNLRLSSKSYKELLKMFSPIADKFVDTLAEQGYIKSDPIQIIGKEFWGLRANISFDNIASNNIDDVEEVEKIISRLDIKPQLIVFNETGVDLFFKPNQVINLKSDTDYISLVHSFIDYIHKYSEYNIKFLGWSLEDCEMISNISYKESDISFTRDLFDWEEVSITCLGLDLMEI